jgi:hypothetical protein
MAKEIVDCFNQVNKSYESLIQKSSSKFHALKRNDFDELAKSHEEEKKAYMKLVLEQKKLKEVIVQKCGQKGLSDKKLNNLIPYFKIEEKEKVRACQQTAFTYAQKLKNVLASNAQLSQSLMQVVQNELDIAMHMAQHENRGSKSFFINENL